MDVVLVFPGQGSQKPGMGKDLFESLPAARGVFERADKALGAQRKALSALCFDGPAEELTLTQNAQPALLVHGLAAWAAVCDAVGGSVVAAAGHSLGELTAYAAAASLRLEDAVRLVRKRGELMYESGIKRPGTMAAILGDLSEPIESICARASARASLVVPANFNSPGQVVISGEESGVELAMTLCKEAGAKRAIRLNVSGAFHSPLMEPAAAGLASALGDIAFARPRFPVYSNVTAEAIRDEATGIQRLKEQLCSPVQWAREVDAMVQAHPGALFIELGPGTVLLGLIRKIAPSAATAPCGTLADVTALRERLAA